MNKWRIVSLSLYKFYVLIPLAVCGGMLLLYSLSPEKNWFQITIEGLLALVATFFGVYLAEHLTVSREYKFKHKEDMSALRKYMSLTFSEILDNYRVLKRTYNKLHAEEVPRNVDKVDLLEFFSKLLVFNKIVYHAFLSSGHITCLNSDEQINGLQQIYSQIYEMEFTMRTIDAVNTPRPMKPYNENTSRQINKLFELMNKKLSVTVRAFESNIPVLQRTLVKLGITYNSVSEDGRILNALDAEQYKIIGEIE